MTTLWDLLTLRPFFRPAAAAPVAPGRPPAPPLQAAPASPPASPRDRAGSPPRERRAQGPGRVNPAAGSKAGMQERYEAVTREMLATHGVKVRKWRTAMSGIAWEVYYKDGTTRRFIEAPRPKGPMSAAVFLHEIGHHAIGFHTYKPRCLEEFHAWRWSLEAMEAQGLNITDAVRRRVHRSLYYAVQKAKRRGIKQIPAELGPYLEKPARRGRKG